MYLYIYTHYILCIPESWTVFLSIPSRSILFVYVCTVFFAGSEVDCWDLAEQKSDWTLGVSKISKELSGNPWLQPLRREGKSPLIDANVVVDNG